MLSVKEVSKLTGVSVRTLHYYDEIGLLKPARISESGYRFYDDSALERLQQILLYRELEFPLKDIKKIMDSPNFNRQKALEQQIELLTLKKEHLENVILFARGIKLLGVKAVDFSAFDTKKLDEYARRAKENWGNTQEYKMFEEKQRNLSKKDEQKAAEDIMTIFAEFGTMRYMSVDSEEVREQVKKLRDFITEYFYDCTPKIFLALAKMYSGGGEFTENIDNVGGKGTAEFAAKAIEAYVKDEL